MDNGNFKFGEDYLKYWQSITNASDGKNKPPDSDTFESFLKFLNPRKNDKILDCGCSFGRLFPVLSKYSKEIYGIDIDQSVINDATQYDYISLNIGSAENSNLPSNYFDKVIMFGVFDVTEQERALIEQNRILKNGGKLLVTGKNHQYRDDDDEASIAERNARLKNFPNHFTDVRLLINQIKEFGFELEKALIFEKRGDFGKARYKEDIYEVDEFYEFCLYLVKYAPSKDIKFRICDNYSLNAKKSAKERGYSTVDEYFKHHIHG